MIDTVLLTLGLGIIVLGYVVSQLIMRCIFMAGKRLAKRGRVRSSTYCAHQQAETTAQLDE